MRYSQLKVLNRKRLFFLILLFATFQTFYFYGLQLSLFSIFSFVLSVICVEQKGFQWRDLQETTVFYILILLSLCVNIPSGHYFNINSLLGIFIGPVCYLITKQWLREFSHKEITLIVNKVLIFHLFFFYLQLIWYIAFGEVLDFLGTVTGESSRNLNNLGVIRASGLFNEPMVYSFFMFSLLLARKMNKDIGLDSVAIVVLISMIISLSSWGIVGSCLYILAEVRFDKSKIAGLVALFLVIIIIFYFTGIGRLMSVIWETRFAQLDQDGSFQYRYGLTAKALSENPDILFFGNGLAVPGKNGILELSLFLQIVTNLGLILGGIFLFIALRPLLALTKLKLILLLCVFFTADLRFQQLYFWFFVAFINVSQSRSSKLGLHK